MERFLSNRLGLSQLQLHALSNYAVFTVRSQCQWEFKMNACKSRILRYLVRAAKSLNNHRNTLAQFTNPWLKIQKEKLVVLPSVGFDKH